MIRHQTARRLMYDWHGGQRSPMYAAASSGLVGDWESLRREVSQISDQHSRDALEKWLEGRRIRCEIITRQGRIYACLPWVNDRRLYTGIKGAPL